MFKCYNPKRCGMIHVNDQARLTQESIKFSEEAWKNFLKESSYVAFYYDEDMRQIGMKPCRQGEGLKITARSKRPNVIPEIHWAGFLKAFCLEFQEPRMVKMEVDESLKMVVMKI